MNDIIEPVPSRYTPSFAVLQAEWWSLRVGVRLGATQLDVSAALVVDDQHLLKEERVKQQERAADVLQDAQIKDDSLAVGEIPTVHHYRCSSRVVFQTVSIVRVANMAQSCAVIYS